MIIILFCVLAKPGKHQKLIEFLEWDSEVSNEHEEGTLRFDYFEDPRNKNSFYVFEVYKNPAAFLEHQKNHPYQCWSSYEFQNEVIANFNKLYECGLSV